jgi:hypothetical protein
MAGGTHVHEWAHGRSFSAQRHFAFFYVVDLFVCLFDAAVFERSVRWNASSSLTKNTSEKHYDNNTTTLTEKAVLQVRKCGNRKVHVHVWVVCLDPLLFLDSFYDPDCQYIRTKRITTIATYAQGTTDSIITK